jgi:PncC family amidohydrolase
MNRPEEELVSLLSARGMTFATAESCTGGLIPKKITDVAGCSSVYLGGVVSYANSVKQNVLGVSGETLGSLGPVCRETAEQMVRGVRALTGADVAVATTGIAGPGGGTPEKPVGLVYIAASCRDTTVVTENRFEGDRTAVREKAAARALEMAIELIKSN